MMTQWEPAKPLALIINGPNLNLLGVREPAIYGSESLRDVEREVARSAERLGWDAEFLQSNHEGALIDAIHAARGRASGIVLNPGGLTHTSVALRDAVVSADVPTIEVHVSNIHSREAFRDHSFISGVARSVIVGAGTLGYGLALEILAHDRLERSA